MPDDPASSPRPASSGNRSGNARRRRRSGGGGNRSSGQGGGRGSGGNRSGQTRSRPVQQSVQRAEQPPPTVAPLPLDDTAPVVRNNRRRAWRVAAVPAVTGGALVAAVLAAVGLPVVSAAGVVVAVVVAVVLQRSSTGVVLRALEASPADEDDAPGAFTQIEGLCATMGLALPDVFIVDDPHPDAMSVGRSGVDAAVVLTTGLLGDVDPVVLEAVLAHELTHVKRNDTAPATVAAALMLLVPLFPDPGGRVHRLAGRGREFQADAEAVRVTRFPPGLRQALDRMAADGGTSVLMSRRAGKVTRWLWTAALPAGEGGDVDCTGELDAPAVRMAALDEW